MLHVLLKSSEDVQVVISRCGSSIVRDLLLITDSLLVVQEDGKSIGFGSVVNDSLLALTDNLSEVVHRGLKGSSSLDGVVFLISQILFFLSPTLLSLIFQCLFGVGSVFDRIPQLPEKIQDSNDGSWFGGGSNLNQSFDDWGVHGVFS